MSLGGLDSIQAISALPQALAQHVRDAFRMGVRWAFISLIPWTGLTFISVLFLTNIRDTDRARRSSDAPAAEVQGGGPLPRGEKIHGPVTSPT